MTPKPRFAILGVVAANPLLRSTIRSDEHTSNRNPSTIQCDEEYNNYHFHTRRNDRHEPYRTRVYSRLFPPTLRADIYLGGVCAGLAVIDGRARSYLRNDLGWLVNAGSGIVLGRMSNDGRSGYSAQHFGLSTSVAAQAAFVLHLILSQIPRWLSVRFASATRPWLLLRLFRHVQR